MHIWILRPFVGDGSMKINYERERIYSSYDAVHAYALEVAWELESKNESPEWCVITEYEATETGQMEANWIYRPVSGTQMNRWPVVIQI